MKKLFEQVKKEVGYRVPLVYVTGSRLYGAFLENSDYDVRGFYAPSVKDLLMQKKNKVYDVNKVNENGVKVDFTFPSVADFCKQLVKNPNYAELFDPSVVLLNDEYNLHEKADWFVSKVLFKSVRGFFEKEKKFLESYCHVPLEYLDKPLLKEYKKVLLLLIGLLSRQEPY